MSQLWAPSTVFSASAVCSDGAEWGTGGLVHLRVHAHPGLGLPAAPFLVVPASGKLENLTEDMVAVTDGRGQDPGHAWSDNELRLPPGEAYLWLSLPCGGLTLHVRPEGAGPVVVDALATTGAGPLTSLRPLVRRQADRETTIRIVASAIGLLRITSPEGGTVVALRGWPQETFAADGVRHIVTAFGPPSRRVRWYWPLDTFDGIVSMLDGAAGFPVGDPDEQAWWRVREGAPKKRGPGDRGWGGPWLGPDDEVRRVEALLARPGRNLRNCLDQLLGDEVHPLVDPPWFEATTTHTSARTGASSSDVVRLPIADLLGLSTADAGVARWLGTLTLIPDGLFDQPAASEGEWDQWHPTMVIGTWRVPEAPTDPMLAALVASSRNLAGLGSYLTDAHPTDLLADDARSGTRAVVLACALALPLTPDELAIASSVVEAPSGRRDRAWVQGSAGAPLSWRQSLRFPDHVAGEATTGIPAGARVVIRSGPSPSDPPVTPVLEADQDGLDVDGRAVPWLPRTDTPGGARFLDSAIPAGEDRTWAAWVVDEFGRWSTEPATATANPPAPLDPPPPGLQVRFTPATADEADARAGRGHLWVRASLAPEHPAGTKVVVGIVVDLGGTATPYAAPDTGWVDRGDDLPILAVASVGTVVVTASTACTPTAVGAEASQVVDIIDGRLPEPIPDLPEVRWTSRPTPVGSATLRYRTPSASRTRATVHLTDEPRMYHHCRTALGLEPPPLDGMRTARADFYWAQRARLPRSLFTVAGSAPPGVALDLTVPGRLGDLLLVKVVAEDRNGRPGRWADAPPFLYAVPDATVPPPPQVNLDHDGTGRLRVVLAGAPGALSPERWQLLTCTDSAVDDVRAFLRTDKDGPGPMTFELDAPAWVPIRVAGRAALGSEALGGSGSADPLGEWSSPTSPRSFVYVPVDPPMRPQVDVTLDLLGEVRLAISLANPPHPRAIGPHLALVRRWSSLVGVPGAGLKVFDPVPFGRTGRATLVDPVHASLVVWWKVAVQDPSERVGPATTIAASSLQTID